MKSKPDRVILSIIMMKPKLGQTLRVLGASLALGISISIFSVQSARAVAVIDCPDGTKVTVSDPASEKNACDGRLGTGPDSTKGINPYKDDCRVTEKQKADGVQLDKSNCRIILMVVTITNILSALVGIVIVLAITVAGIQYSMAGGDPQKVTAAKHRIRSALVALLLYIFMFAFLQWIVPGGMF